MKVMVIVKATRDSEAGQMPSAELLQAMGKYNEQLLQAGIMLAGEGLHPSAKGARVRFSGNNRTVVPGPFAATEELIAGFWIWRVASLDDAIDWVRRCPNPMMVDSDIEIRPIFEAEDFGEALSPEMREQEARQRAQTLGLDRPRFELKPALRIAGPNRSYTEETRSQIADQWHQFAPQIGHVPGQVPGRVAYGVVWNNRPNCEFDYIAGVELRPGTAPPQGMQAIDLEARRWAVFMHQGNVALIGKTLEAIWGAWVPDCGLAIAKTPCVECYTEEFDPQTGTGGTEIWVPLEG